MVHQVTHGVFIQDKYFPWTMQQGQKILTTLALSAAKPGKERITNNGAIPILTLVPGPGVVCLQVVAMKQTFCQKFIFFCMKSIMTLSQKITEPTGGNRCPHIPQGFEQHRLGNSTGVMLVQNIAPKFWTKVRTLNILWRTTTYVGTIRGKPVFQLIAGDEYRKRQLLYVIMSNVFGSFRVTDCSAMKIGQRP